MKPRVQGRLSPGADDTDRTLVKALEEFVPHVMRQHHTPGLGLALARHGEVVWEAGFGLADPEADAPWTPETTIRSGSMGKTYTATAVMQLVERGVLALDDPINRHLVAFQIANPLGERDITVEDLLTHRSGLTSNAAACDFVPPKPLGEHLDAVYSKEQNDFYGGALTPFWTAKVGELFQYSNTGIATLGYLVEVTNPERLTFSDYVQRHVIDPLGMTSTQYPPVQNSDHVRPDLFGRLSRGYARLGSVHVPTPTVYLGDFPAGTVVTTPGDHLKLLLAYLENGSLGGRRILDPQTVELMLTPRVREIYPGVDLGLVWMLREHATPAHAFWHKGAHMWGWTNSAIAWPPLGTALVVCVNQWNLLEGTHAPRYVEGDLISRFVSDLLGDGPGGKEKAAARTQSWGWKVSYVIGLTMAERLLGTLGIPSELRPEMIDAIESGVRPDAGAAWDPAGFRAGVQDLCAAELTPDGIRAFLISPRLRVAHAELELLNVEAGGLIGSPAVIPL